MSLLLRGAEGSIPNFPLPNERLPPPLSWEEYNRYQTNTTFDNNEDVPTAEALAERRRAYAVPYDAHAGFYRNINPEDDLSEPWKASPPRLRDGVPLAPDYVKPVFDLPESFRAQHAGHSKLPRKPVAVVSPGVPVSVRSGSRQFSPNSLSSSWTTATSSTVVGNKHNASGPLVSVATLKVEKKGAKTLWQKLLQLLRRSSEAKSEPLPIVLSPPPPAPLPKRRLKVDDNPYAEPVPLGEWKQYGYWARPFVNDLQVKNSPVNSEISVTTQELVEIIRNVRDPEENGGQARPERWKIGTKHRALPPCPKRWANRPNPREPLPFPWEVQVNPLLQHPLFGAQPLTWAVFADPLRDMTVFYGHGALGVDPLGEGDLAQPATWPWLTTMYFCDVLGDGAPEFQWPFSVHNPRGIKVADVLRGIFECFDTPLLEDEFNSWDKMRQDACRRTHVARQNLPLEGGHRVFRDLRRRSDSLGAMMWFRGIEPSVTGRGWMIAFGTY